MPLQASAEEDAQTQAVRLRPHRRQLRLGPNWCFLAQLGRSRDPTGMGLETIKSLGPGSQLFRNGADNRDVAMRLSVVRHVHVKSMWELSLL